MLVALMIVPLVNDVDVQVALTYSPTLPALTLLLVVVPTMPFVWLGVKFPVALSVVKAPELAVALPIGGGDTSESVLAEAAVMSPLALTVKDGICVELPNEPVFAFTVASVVAVAPAVVEISPEKAGMSPAANVPLVTWDAAIAMALAAAAVALPFPSRVTVTVCEASPKLPTLLLTVASVVTSEPAGDVASPDNCRLMTPVWPLTD